MNDKSKIIDKIRKLLALSKSPNENEAARAAEKVQELLAQYNIDATEVEIKEAEATVSQEGVQTVARAWHRIIRHAAASMYFCEYYYSTFREPAPQRKRGFKKFEVHFYVGEPHNVAIAKMMSDYLISTVWRLAREGARQYPKRERNRYRKSFVNACSFRLRVRIFARIQELRESNITTHEGTTLPALASLYDKAQEVNRAFIARNVGGLGRAKGRMRSSHRDGHLDGHVAGDSISLENQGGKIDKSNHLISKD